MADCKAWIVRENGEPYAAVVFAETRGKARALAQSTDACDYVDFVNIEVRRIKDADKYYKPGKRELDCDKGGRRMQAVMITAIIVIGLVGGFVSLCYIAAKYGGKKP